MVVDFFKHHKNLILINLLSSGLLVVIIVTLFIFLYDRGSVLKHNPITRSVGLATVVYTVNDEQNLSAYGWFKNYYDDALGANIIYVKPACQNIKNGVWSFDFSTYDDRPLELLACARAGIELTP